MSCQKIFTNEIIDYLISEEGERALHLAKELDFSRVSDVARLRKICTIEQSRAVIELSELRKRASEKFRLSDKMFFDRVGYEQSSGEDVAGYKAGRFYRQIGEEKVADLCCGIGGDTIALCKRGDVLACDISAERIRMTELNVGVYDVCDRCEFICDDVSRLVFEDVSAFHIDPDRRRGMQRGFSIEQMSPGVEVINELLKRVPNGAIKLSPACDYEELPWEGEIELISSHGRCKQLILWTGKFASVRKRATSITSGESISDDIPVRYKVSDIGEYLYDPDACCSRLNLLGQLAYLGELDFLAPGQIVLTANEVRRVPLAKIFKVMDLMPYREDKLLKYFRNNKYSVTVKPRGVDINVDRLSKRLTRGGEDRYLFVLRLDKKVIAVVAKRIS